MSRVPRLAVTFSLLAGFTVADISYSLDYPVGIVFAGVGFAVGREIKTRAAMSAKDIAGQEGVA